jgi:hypothetical protein
MATMNYSSSVAEIVTYLIDHKNEWITDSELLNLSPQYAERIIDELIAIDAVTSTKDGICYDDDNYESLKKYVKRLGINIY